MKPGKAKLEPSISQYIWESRYRWAQDHAVMERSIEDTWLRVARGRDAQGVVSCFRARRKYVPVGSDETSLFHTALKQDTTSCFAWPRIYWRAKSSRCHS